MGAEMEQLRVEAVQKATWWQDHGDFGDEGELTKAQLETVVSEINRLGKQGVHGTGNSDDDAVGIRLEVSGNVWEIRRASARNKVEIRLIEQDYSVGEQSEKLIALLEQLNSKE